MNRSYRHLLIASLAISSAIAGCTLIAETDRTKIDDGTPDGSGGMGDGGDGGEDPTPEPAGGAGGGGGGVGGAAGSGN